MGDSKLWSEDLSGRERVRQVVGLLEAPTTVQEITDRAEVSPTTADGEFDRLESDDWVIETLSTASTESP